MSPDRAVFRSWSTPINEVVHLPAAVSPTLGCSTPSSLEHLTKRWIAFLEGRRSFLRCHQALHWEGRPPFAAFRSSLKPFHRCVWLVQRRRWCAYIWSVWGSCHATHVLACMHAWGVLYCFAFTWAGVGLKVVEGDGSVQPCLKTTFLGFSSLGVVLLFRVVISHVLAGRPLYLFFCNLLSHFSALIFFLFLSHPLDSLGFLDPSSCMHLDRINNKQYCSLPTFSGWSCPPPPPALILLDDRLWCFPTSTPFVRTLDRCKIEKGPSIFSFILGGLAYVCINCAT